MPNWKTHLEVAKRCNEFLKYNDNDYMLFLFGNILPDINNQYIVNNLSKEIDRNITHFKNSDSNAIHINFLNSYKDKINKPLVFGYYTHLFTDYSFNDFAYSKINNDNNLKNKDKIELRKFKQSEFKKYNANFKDNNLFITNIDLLVNETKNIPEIYITKDDINKIIDFLNIKENDSNLTYFSKDDLDNTLNNVINNIKNFYLNK